MKRFVFPVLLVLSVLLVGLPASTRAADILQFQTSGLGTLADFTTASECMVTRVRLQAADERVKQVGKPATPSQVLLFIGQYDTCAQKELVRALAQVDVLPSAFQVDQQLNTATLQATGLEIFDYASATVLPVDISLTWKATGEARRLKGGHTESLGDFTLRERYDESFRPSVAFGTVTLAGSANLTAEPTEIAKIESIRLNETVISQ